jgi:membrane protease YdiL (CAAX protease family)
MLGASFFFGWLILKARSFWPAALAHAAVNSIQEGVISNLHLDVPELYEDILRTGLMAAFGLICWTLLRPQRPVRQRSRRRDHLVETGA